LVVHDEEIMHVCGLPDLRAPLSINRRGFLKASGAITAAALVGTITFGGIAAAAALTRAERDKLTPDEVPALMTKGNKRFYTGFSLNDGACRWPVITSTRAQTFGRSARAR
jgi:hypothetical protein